MLYEVFSSNWHRTPPFTCTNVRGHYTFAGKDCQQCMEFVILTHEYRKSVLDATVDKPKAIPDLVKQYSQYVLQLFNSSNPL